MIASDDQRCQTREGLRRSLGSLCASPEPDAGIDGRVEKIDDEVHQREDQSRR